MAFDMGASESKGSALRKKISNSWSELLPENATYLDLTRNFDGRSHIKEKLEKEVGVDLDLSKAASITGLTAGTTDLSLVPLYVDPTIIDMTRRLTPLVELIPRVTNYGRTAEFNRLTGRGVVGWRPEDGALAEQDDTYERKSTLVKSAYQVGRVTGMMQAASKQYLSQNYVDMLNLEVRNKSLTMRFMEEDTFLNGNSTSRTAYGGVTTLASYEPVGIRNYSGIQSTNLSGAKLGLSDLRAGIRKARTANDSATLGQGNPNLIVTDFTTFDNLKGQMMDYQRFVDTSKLTNFGITSFSFDGLDVVPSKFMPTTASQHEAVVLDTGTWQARVLQDMTYEELAKNNDSYKFMIKLYETLICTAPEFNTRIYGIE